MYRWNVKRLELFKLKRNIPNMQMPWNGTIPDGGPSYCFDFATFKKSDCIDWLISVSREKQSII